MKTILNTHLQNYPQIQAQDVIKLCFQNEFGCEHMISTQEKSLQHILDESTSLSKKEIKIESIGNHLVRFHFGQLSSLEAYTLNQLFILTANTCKGNKESFIQKLKECQEELNDETITQYINNYLKQGIKPISHSSAYHDAYEPHYRILREDLAYAFPLFLKINKLKKSKDHLLIAIDGKCGSGKTTLALLLNEIYQGNVFHMDDFFLQPYQRTSSRLEKPGENVDHERFLKEVLEPLSFKQNVLYQPFDCSKMALSNEIETILNKPINIIEGTYSLHPNLIDYYDLKIALTIDDHLQMERIVRRNGSQMAEKFRDLWIPLENRYFNELHIFYKADVCCETSKNHVEILP